MMFEEMPHATYYSSSLGFLALSLAGAIFVPDIAVVFLLLGAFVMTFIQFFWPAFFYLKALRLFPEAES